MVQNNIKNNRFYSVIQMFKKVHSETYKEM